MNSINATAAANLIPFTTSRLADTSPTVPGFASESPSQPRMADQVTWSPGLWWLLFRYEYLFDGLLPDPGNGQQMNTYEKPDSMSCGRELASAQPHWDERQLVNPPPTLATREASDVEVPSVTAAPVSQPSSVGAFVDLLA